MNSTLVLNFVGLMQIRYLIFIVLILLLLFRTTANAQPDDFDGVVAEKKWTVLHLQTRRDRGSKQLSKKSKIKALESLNFKGPKPGHPFVLGNYAVDGKWGLVNGYVQKLSGKDAALQLCWADQFELEGVIEHAQFGGWFFLIGWDKEHGYSISNVNLKTSGSPWFVSEMRGAKSIEEKTTEFDHFNWKGEQPFLLSVKEKELTLKVGRFNVLSTPIENYKPGAIIMGVYDTEYGPKPIRIKSLRVRSQPSVVDDM